MNIPLSRACLPENLVSRDGFSRPVPRPPAHLHTQAEPGAYLRDSSRVLRRRPFMKPPYAIGSVPSLSGHAITYRWRSLPVVRETNVNMNSHTNKVMSQIESRPWSQGRKKPSGRGKLRTTYSPYKEKTAMVQKILGKSDISKEKKGRNKKRKKQNRKRTHTVLCNCVWLSGRMQRRTTERTVASVKAKKAKSKENKTNVTPEKYSTTSARRVQVRDTTCG